MKTANRFDVLWLGYLNDDLTPADAKELLELIANGNQLQEEDIELLFDQLPDIEVADSERVIIYDSLRNRMRPTHRARIRLMPSTWLRYAAAIILLLSAVAYFFITDRKAGGNNVNNPSISQIDKAPGKEGAILTLSDGTKLVLDSLGNGLITSQQGTQISLQDKQLVYTAEPGNPDIVGTNTLYTPKGRQFSLVLPDSTKVWLNAATSITYPTVFTGKERVVAIEGEAYFEVTKKASQPFKVKVNGHSMVEVLGTRFNINAYSNEPGIKTTLLQGSVRITHFNYRQTLVPGEQLQMAPDGNTHLLKQVNLRQVTAWKNGVFDFNRASLQEVMRQLERWYDIEVTYAGTVPDIQIQGSMERSLHLSQILKILGKMDVKYKLEQNGRLIIQP
mgnify:CR=1 FL=1|jgi:Fe2+-dicitrate sensor, membrane component